MNNEFGGVTLLVTPTVSTTPAYTAGDCLGGKNTIAGAVRATGFGAKLETLTIVDKGDQAAAGIDVIFFSSDPTNSTFTDNAALAMNDADAVKILGVVSVLTADWVALNGSKAATKAPNLRFTVATPGANIFCVLVARGTPTQASTTDIQVTLGLLQD
jgi:hypothetical protein